MRIARVYTARELLGIAAGSVALEVLHGALVFLGRGARRECAEIAAPARFRIQLARIQPELSGREFADHARQ
jgi:hypothetical protein